MHKLILKNFLSPGDIVMLTATVRDLHKCYPYQFVTDVRTSCMELWENNPYLTPLKEGDPGVVVLECEYPLVNRSNELPYHFLHGFTEHLNQSFGMEVKTTEFKGDIHLSDAERNSPAPVEEFTGEEIPYWVVAAGGKFDVTIKWWESERYQAVVDYFKGRIQFVQVGHAGHYHPKLEGAIDLRGKTTLRDLVRLVHHAQGVLCGITAMMHLAAAVETRPGSPPRRPCVVIAGGREPVHWVEYPNHQFVHTVGQLRCCAHGGCWKARTVPLGDGDRRDEPDWLCANVAGKLPRCMDMITPAEVIRRIERYFDGDVISYLSREQASAGTRGVEMTSANPYVIEFPKRRNRRERERGVLIQQASGIYTRMLDLTHNRHSSYAARHDFAFWPIRGDVQRERPPVWNKIVLVQMAFSAGFEFVAWLDADTLIVRPECDLRQGLEAGAPIGMCRHPGGWGDPPWHYNAGVILIRNTEAARDFFNRTWNDGPVDHHWQEQFRMNELARKNPELVRVIDDIWNSTAKTNPADDPVVQAWHGEGEKAIPLMEEALAALEQHSRNGQYYHRRESIGRFAAAANP